MRHTFCRFATRLRHGYWHQAALVLMVCAAGLGISRPSGASEDSKSSAAVRERQTAVREFEKARRAVSEARAAADAARRDLDSLVALRPDEPSNRRGELEVKGPADDSESEPPAASDLSADTADWIGKKLQQLQIEREDLLQRMTPAHPSIVEIDRRIADLEARLGKKRRPATNSRPSDGRATQPGKRRSSQSSKAAAERRRAQERWEAAQRELESAIETEGEAARRWSEAEEAATREADNQRERESAPTQAEPLRQAEPEPERPAQEQEPQAGPAAEPQEDQEQAAPKSGYSPVEVDASPRVADEAPPAAVSPLRPAIGHPKASGSPLRADPEPPTDAVSPPASPPAAEESPLRKPRFRQSPLRGPNARRGGSPLRSAPPEPSSDASAAPQEPPSADGDETSTPDEPEAAATPQPDSEAAEGHGVPVKVLPPDRAETSREIEPGPIADRPEPAASRPRTSPRWVIAGLAVVVVVIVLAVIRLARSGESETFASTEEIGASLKLPVVAVVPSAQMSAATARRPVKARRGLRLVGQLLLAVVVFAVVAYLVQAAGRGWGTENGAVKFVSQVLERVGVRR